MRDTKGNKVFILETRKVSEGTFISVVDPKMGCKTEYFDRN